MLDTEVASVEFNTWSAQLQWIPIPDDGDGDADADNAEDDNAVADNAEDDGHDDEDDNH